MGHPADVLCLDSVSRVSRVRLFATLLTVTCRLTLSVGIQEENWSGLPAMPSSGIFQQGIRARLLQLQQIVFTV